MATIVPFVANNSPRPGRKPPEGPAQLLMFTGVRYERTEGGQDGARGVSDTNRGPKRNSR